MTTNQQFKNDIIDRMTTMRDKYIKRMKQFEEDLVRCENNEQSSAEHKAKIAANIRKMMDYARGKIEQCDRIIMEVNSL